MNLLIDVGNTRIKWLLTPSSRLLCQGNIIEIAEIAIQGAWEYSLRIFADELSRQWKDLPTPKNIFVANVAGEALRQQLQSWFKNKWQLQASFIKTESNLFNVKNGYDNPQQLGVDRWLASVAAYHVMKNTVAVIDCGSCITVDVVDQSGQHLGGMIAPGFAIAKSALVKKTQGCHYDFNFDASSLLLGANTQTCIDSGIEHMAVGFIEIVCQKLKTSYADISIIITGGDAKQLQQQLSVDNLIYCENMVLCGLALLAVKNV